MAINNRTIEKIEKLTKNDFNNYTILKLCPTCGSLFAIGWLRLKSFRTCSRWIHYGIEARVVRSLCIPHNNIGTLFARYFTVRVEQTADKKYIGNRRSRGPPFRMILPCSLSCNKFYRNTMNIFFY